MLFTQCHTLFTILTLSITVKTINGQDYRYQTYGGDNYSPQSPQSVNPYNPQLNQYGQQNNYQNRPYNQQGRSGTPSYRPNGYPGYNYPGDETILLPGILGRWRPDLQGKERPDSKQLDRDVFVSTKYGQVQGFKVHLYDNPLPESGYRPFQTPVEREQAKVAVFLGIPYAAPPINEGRFRPPRPHKGWQIHQAVDFGPACPQPAAYIGITKGVPKVDEDCLYLNIFMPSTDVAPAKPYPVMFYIHGGDFVHGSSNSFNGHMMAAFYNVVVVAINYRLGALGFLSTCDENSPGNYGIMDQAMALRWVYDNIEFFLGDRKSITLFGPDAGAASAGLLMVNPKTSFMVSKVIAQSGSALADWALIKDRWRALNTTKVYAAHIGCSTDSTWKIVDCLKRGRSFLELGADFKPQIGFNAWGPIIDNEFLVPKSDWYDGWQQSDWHFINDSVESAIQSGRFNKDLRYLSGVTTQEAAYILHKNKTYSVTEELFNKKVRELVLQYNYTLNPSGVFQAIKYLYTYWPDPLDPDSIRNQYINMLSDFLFVAPHDQMSKLLVAENIPVYLYVLNTTVTSIPSPDWRLYSHDTEYYFLTGAPFMDNEFFPRSPVVEKRKWTDNDRNMSHFFMKAYTNFATYGNPSHSQILGIHFDMAYKGNLKYLNINTTYNATIKQNYRQMESAFWSEYLPTVIGIIVPTYPPTTEFWWEPKTPIQVAFWSLSGLNMILVALTVMLCILWCNAKKSKDHYYNGDVLVVREEPIAMSRQGIDNRSITSNIYEYHDAPIKTLNASPKKTASASTLRTNSAASMRDHPMAISNKPIPQTQV
ncbi:Carboxylesterase type B, conserved site,Carboxylesterase, type B,Alpha/Beta hydrolase fold [Cinara cedri]|uniref:Carboxylesterase type B, conserved site,Carboxylesterase, type B,Alpha/Beta hydrolase fold n=2 Tax=Cinara cedri TaxID=506608 RepID=A0A5E4MHZ1_9HEMI|nr:Carboxylesterase type B, conserved site,Carboxylesterase, type B,Alpha/Beta hydrolase fold [Cinara cedri]